MHSNSSSNSNSSMRVGKSMGSMHVTGNAGGAHLDALGSSSITAMSKGGPCVCAAGDIEQ
jgi:hypothetical protein